jgi:hypothetical protein
VDENGQTLVITTQSATGQSCLATAVDAETGTIRWQRQLGLVTQGDLLVLGQPPQDTLLAMGEGGELMLFDPPGQQFHGRMIAPPWPGQVVGPMYLVPGGDGLTAFQFACVLKEKNRYNLMVRSYPPASPQAEVRVDERRAFEVRAPLAGAPAVGKNFILVPLADRSLLRLPRQGGGREEPGPDWGGELGNAQSVGHVLWVDDHAFVTTNGGRGLTRWQWEPGKDFRSEPDDRDARQPTLELPARIVAPPLLVPPPDGGEALLCLADADGTVWLRRGLHFEVVHRQWQLAGKITAGPFLRSGRLGCIVDQRRLIWLDPAKNKLWEYRADSGILGEPRLLGREVLVATQAGRYLLLGAETGQEQSQGYLLKASVAPAACPIGYGPNLAFAPLTDGTMLLLSLQKLRHP